MSGCSAATLADDLGGPSALVQAHVQAGRGARRAGSGLDEITDPVDQPQALAIQQIMRREPVFQGACLVSRS
jgi:ferritin-like protein